MANKFFEIAVDSHWSIWVITIWLFLFILHFIKIFITDRFMNKNWEREQIDRLVALQQKKLDQLQTQVNNDDLK
ncbi:2TM domain-containing protein [Flavobacterium sp. 11]|uniref:2TM domain-containing protein n=1 Tax=Flavobacterium sp. 11 TaxID=357523 RepID=UPI001E5B9D6B|nr:2TM domain-containing protein [Flavobacterium sp. 11]